MLPSSTFRIYKQSSSNARPKIYNPCRHLDNLLHDSELASFSVAPLWPTLHKVPSLRSLHLVWAAFAHTFLTWVCRRPRIHALTESATQSRNREAALVLLLLEHQMINSTIILALSGKAWWGFTHDCDFLQTDRCSFSINSSSQQKPSSLVFLGFFFFTIVKTDCADHISAALMFMPNVVRTWSLLLWHCRHSVPIKIHLVEAHVGTRLGPVGDSCGFPMFQVYQRLRH